MELCYLLMACSDNVIDRTTLNESNVCSQEIWTQLRLPHSPTLSLSLHGALPSAMLPVLFDCVINRFLFLLFSVFLLGISGQI